MYSPACAPRLIIAHCLALHWVSIGPLSRRFWYIILYKLTRASVGRWRWHCFPPPPPPPVLPTLGGKIRCEERNCPDYSTGNYSSLIFRNCPVLLNYGYAVHELFWDFQMLCCDSIYIWLGIRLWNEPKNCIQKAEIYILSGRTPISPLTCSVTRMLTQWKF